MQKDQLSLITLAVANSYTDESLQGAGALKGVPCQIKSITDITGGHKVTFLWEDNDGTEHEDYMNVMDGVDGQDGADGQDGKGIKRVYINNEEHLMIVYTDDTETDAGAIEVQSAVDSVNGKTGAVELSASDVGALPDNTEIPSKTSDLDNDSNFVADENYVHTDNNYDATAKGIVDGVTAALADKVDKVNGKGLSTNDYDDTAKGIVDGVTAALAEKANTSDLGTAAGKDYTDLVRPNSHDLVESGSVYSAITEAVSSVYTPRGSKTCAELTSALLIDENIGSCYNVTDSGTTTADFIQGEGQTIAAGDTVGIVKAGATAIKFNLMGNTLDLHNYQTKALETAVAGQSTVETALSALNTNKAEKSEMSITDGTGADAGTSTITLKSGLSKKVLTAHQDISGKANKSEMSVTDGTGADADKTTIQLKDGTSATVLKSHQDISGKADKTELADYTTRNELKDTVGWTGKNIYNGRYMSGTSSSGIEWTASSDGLTVTANGTKTVDTDALCPMLNTWVAPFTGMVIGSGCNSGNFKVCLYPWDVDRSARPYKDATKTSTQTNNIYSGNEVSFYVEEGHTYRLSARVQGADTVVDNVAFTPMIRRAEFTDGTYEPYHAPTESYIEDKIFPTLRQAEVIESKNLVKYMARQRTANDITWVAQEDGAIWVTSSNTADKSVFLTEALPLVANQTYVLSAQSTTSSDVWLSINSYNNGTLVDSGIYQLRRSSAVVFTPDYDGYDSLRLLVAVKGEANVSNYPLYPMICTLDEWNRNKTFEPYYIPVKDAMFRRSEQRVLGAKNLIPNDATTTTTEQGVTYTVNADGTVLVASGETMTTYTNLILGSAVLPEGDYILSGCPSGGSSNTYRLRLVNGSTLLGVDSGNGYKFHSDGVTKFTTTIGLSASGMSYTVPSDLLFKPMIRLATDPDDTYAPFVKANKQLTETMLPRDEQRVLGAKNLYDTNATSKTDAYGGVWTVNSDKTITVSGTPTDYEPFSTRSNYILPAGKYILSWNGENLTNVALDSFRLCKGNTEVRIVATNKTNALAFNISDGDDYDNIRIAFKRLTNDVAMSGTIKPMIRLASDPDDTYQPYAMTNRELTKVKVINGTATNTTNNATAATCVVARVGRVCQFIFGFTLTAAVNVGSNISFTISGLPKPKGTAFLSGFAASSLFVGQFASDMSLTIRVLGADAGNTYSVISGCTYITEA